MAQFTKLYDHWQRKHWQRNDIREAKLRQRQQARTHEHFCPECKSPFPCSSTCKFSKKRGRDKLCPICRWRERKRIIDRNRAIRHEMNFKEFKVLTLPDLTIMYYDTKSLEYTMTLSKIIAKDAIN